MAGEPVGAAWQLGEHREHPERAIPALISSLSSTNKALIEKAAESLGIYGQPAQPALPLLSNLLSHPNPRITLAASNAIVAISATDH